jgi:YjbE family integral membrane protein
MLEVFDSTSLSTIFSGVWADMGQSSFWIGVMQIIWIDILLAGDNAVVIALACRNLPPKMRVWGMVFGAGAAILLRILATLVIATLMTVPFLKIAGGLALFYIAVKLLVPEDEENAGDKIASSERLWQAVRIIVLADLVMSLDNVIAIAAASKGHALLFIFGLAVSIPLIVAGAGMVMTLLTRFPALIWAGGALLGWIAAQVIFNDPAIRPFFDRRFGMDTAHMLEYLAATAGALAVIAAGYKVRPGPSQPA